MALLFKRCHLQTQQELPSPGVPESWAVVGISNTTPNALMFSALDLGLLPLPKPRGSASYTTLRTARNSHSGLCSLQLSEGLGHGPGLYTLTHPTGVSEQVGTPPQDSWLDVQSSTSRAPRGRGKLAPDHCSEGPPGVLQGNNSPKPQKDRHARSRPRGWPGSSQAGESVCRDGVSGSPFVPSPSPAPRLKSGNTAQCGVQAGQPSPPHL